MKKFLFVLCVVLVGFNIFRELTREPVIEVRTEIKEVIKEVVKEVVKEPEPIKKTEPKVKLIKTTFEDLAGWKNDEISSDINIEKAFVDSCNKIEVEKNEFMSNSIIKIPTEKYKILCKEYKLSQKKYDFKTFIENNFVPYLVTENGVETGKFTSYYESRVNASFNKSAKYKYPIHGKPKDLIEIRLKDFDETLPSKVLIGRVKNNKVIKYYTRAEIYNKEIDAPVILWADSFIDIYVMQIQGSAVAHLDNGQDIRIGYAESNGFPFKGIGSILLGKGLLKSGEASMGNIKKWLEKNGDVAVENMLENERYIFHRIVDADGPVGAQGVPLRAGRSMAVDRAYIPLGSLIWLETTGPDKEKIEKLVVAQDIGSAIKGAVRGDYFWGSGNDEILDKAGRMNSQGRYFILVPKNVVMDDYEPKR